MERRLKQAKRGRLSLAVVIALLAFVILPTGTPEDLVTTLPLYAALGVQGYAVVAAVTLFLAVLSV